MPRFKVELSRFGLEKTKKRQKLCFFMQPTHNNYRLCGIISFYYPQSILSHRCVLCRILCKLKNKQ